MRATHTFVLRLLVDSDDPQAMRSLIRAVGGAEELTFADGQALLALRQMVGRVADTGRSERHDDFGMASTEQTDRQPELD